MKAIVCEKFAPLEQLQYTDIPAPQAGPGQVVIDIKAIGVNYPDGLLVQGLYQIKPPFPFIPGSEVAGVVSAVGAEVTHLKTGDRVMAFCGLGGYAEKVACDAANTLPIPEPIPDTQAAALITAHATAHHALKQRAQLQPGETLLVTGAAGGTGLAAVQIGKAMGATVIAACSSAEKLATARDNGADSSINYSTQDLKSEIKNITDGKGVDVVYETVGGDIFDTCSRCVGWNGRLLVIGFASGQIPKFPVNLALLKGYSVVGVFWGSFTTRQPREFAQNMQELMQWYGEGKVKVVVDSALPLENASAALARVMDRKVRGKVVLQP